MMDAGFRNALRTLELFVFLQVPGLALAEVVDQSVAVPADAELTQLAQTEGLLAVENRNAVAVAADDLDADGDADIVVWHRLPEEPPFLFMNDGQGRLEDDAVGRFPRLDGGQTLTAILADIDGDGDRDAYLGRTPEDHLWLNEGRGVFTDATAQWLPAGWGGSTDVGVGDLTGEGRVDVLVLQNGVVRVLENLGSGLREMTDEAFAQRLEGIACVGLVDADEDGTQDLVAVDDARVRLFANDRARFQESMNWPNVRGERGSRVTSGDLDGDGAPDVLISRHGRPLLLVQDRSRLSWQLRDALLRVHGMANSAVLADVNGDGRLDVFLPMTGPNALLLNPGAGQPWIPTTGWLPPHNEASRAAVVVDLNGDHRPDIYIANDGQDLLWLQRQTSPSSVTPKHVPK